MDGSYEQPRREIQKIIEKRESEGKRCDILHVAKLDNDRESAFLIQDMFPVTEEYIEREYTIAQNHLRVTSEALAKVIDRKCRVTLGMIRRGVKLFRDASRRIVN